VLLDAARRAGCRFGDRPGVRDDDRPGQGRGQLRSQTHHLLLLQSRVPREIQGGSGEVPRTRGTRAGSRRSAARGHRLHLPDGSRGPSGPSGRLPKVRHGPRAGSVDNAGDAGRVHLPDASRDRARRTRRMPDLRHGAGAAHRHRGGRAERRADRHDAADVDRRGADAAGVRAGDGRHGSRHGARWPDRSAHCELGRVAGPRFRTATRTCSR
jgi:hypothetical protein